MTFTPDPVVHIVMCTHMGERFIRKQLDSIASQTHTNWRLFVSDDDSTDQTKAILLSYLKQWGSGKIQIFKGPALGSTRNFLSVVKRLNIEADYYAFSDQDDEWEPDRLLVGIQRLAEVPPEIGGLYFSRTTYISESGEVLGFSKDFRRPPSFENALIQSIGGGNTMLINRAAMQEFKAYSFVDVVAHDWWAYILISGLGGVVIYDSTPMVKYRQHSTALVGENVSFGAYRTRAAHLAKGRFRSWNDRNLNALEPVRDKLSTEARRSLDLFTESRKSNLLLRVWYLIRSGVYRQRRLETFAIHLLNILGKI